MILLHQIGERVNSNFNTLDEILRCDDVLGFDGIYESVYENYRALKGKKVVFFVMGDYVGKDNSFDVGQPYSRYCTWDQIIEMTDYLGAEIGWHTRTHPNLTQIQDDDTLRREVTPPFPMKKFAYPYGEVDERVERAVREAGFEDAWSVRQGHGGPFQRDRPYLNW